MKRETLDNWLNPIGTYFSIALRVLPVLCLITPFFGWVSEHVLFAIFEKKELFFRPALFSMLMISFLGLFTLHSMDRLNKVIWFRKRSRADWLAIYKSYQYIFATFGLINLLIGMVLTHSYFANLLDWFRFRDFTFSALIFSIFLMPVCLVYKFKGVRYAI